MIPALSYQAWHWLPDRLLDFNLLSLAHIMPILSRESTEEPV
jgi:hypothetical protein